MIPFEISAILLLLVAATCAACDDDAIASGSRRVAYGGTETSPLSAQSAKGSLNVAVPNWIEGGYLAPDAALPVWNACNPLILPLAPEPLDSKSAEGR